MKSSVKRIVLDLALSSEFKDTYINRLAMLLGEDTIDKLIDGVVVAVAIREDVDLCKMYSIKKDLHKGVVIDSACLQCWNIDVATVQFTLILEDGTTQTEQLHYYVDSTYFDEYFESTKI